MMPDGWQDLTLADVARVAGGGTPSKRERAYWNGDIPWATPTDVTGLSGRAISETGAMITEAGLQSSSATLLPPDSLLMTTRATIGACAINRVPMATNQGFQNLVPKQSTGVDFLYYLIQHHKRRLKRLAAGSTFLELSKRAVSGLRVAVPPLSEQRKIAAILSSVDDAIEKTQAVIDQVQVVKRGLMQELLTRGLPERHTRFKQTEVGEIPEGWRTSRIGEIASCDYGTSESLQSCSGEIPVLRMGNLRDGRVSLRVSNISRRIESQMESCSPLGTCCSIAPIAPTWWERSPYSITKRQELRSRPTCCGSEWNLALGMDSGCPTCSIRTRSRVDSDPLRRSG